MSVKYRFSVNGMTATMANDGTKAMIGASMNSGLSAWAGIVSSFISSFKTSATVWNMPHGPTRTGPWRNCIQPNTLRSNKMAYVTNPRMTRSKATAAKVNNVAFSGDSGCDSNWPISRPPPRAQCRWNRGSPPSSKCFRRAAASGRICRLQKDGRRNLTRYGSDLPLLTR